MKGIDTKAIAAELDELANPQKRDENGQPVMVHKSQMARITVKLDKTLSSQVRLREYEEGGHFGFAITLNPCRLHTPGQFTKQLDWVKRTITE